MSGAKVLWALAIATRLSEGFKGYGQLPRGYGMSTEDNSFESRIGKGTKVSGKLSFRAPAKIEGEADGEISGDELLIATGAVVAARITASRLTIAGTVSGEIIA